MSNRRERVLVDLDREIVTTERHLLALKEARRALARTVRVGRKHGESAAEYNARALTLEQAAARIMADGETWSVIDATAAIQRLGIPTERASVGSMLHRASRQTDGQFVKTGYGVYKLRSATRGSRKEEALQQ